MPTEREDREKALLASLNAARGTALDATNTDSLVYVENLAFARAISHAWGTNARLAFLWQPMRCSMDVIERWERILVLKAAPEDSDKVRRLRVAELFARFGLASNVANLTDLLTAKLGDAFVSVDHVSYATAQIVVPDGSYPFGAVGSVPWSSTIAKVLIRLNHATDISDGDFFAVVAKMQTTIDPMLSAWAQLDWYATSAPSPVALPDGPTGAGFFLDTEHNLDEAIFDV